MVWFYWFFGTMVFTMTGLIGFTIWNEMDGD